ncbi:hypothetical protein V8G54_014629 [Vigna mungo]|uniref:Uncharacterized protein n=1 Tax=Vigna mungo TaxID=3915 RepID=A0AAQ3RZM6_VIGMU
MVHQNKATFYHCINCIKHKHQCTAIISVCYHAIIGKSLISNFIKLHHDTTSFIVTRQGKKWPTFLTICFKHEKHFNKTLEYLNLEPCLMISENIQNKVTRNQELHKFSTINYNT